MLCGLKLYELEKMFDLAPKTLSKLPPKTKKAIDKARESVVREREKAKKITSEDGPDDFAYVKEPR